ncbi:hypothetical protein MYX07_06660, partial [Patescibacteria group bacterium AH-259-L07]|nr:hypothetical protein [Patescibacteria group bacterium AH-259-L07]
KVPPPTFCPECRFQRRAAFRNERRLFRVKSTKSNKSILALLPEDAGMTIYDEKEWWSDNWDALEYGREYDFSRPFFDQFRDLMREVPWYNKSVLRMINSEHCANASDLKNCYLMFNSNVDEDCAYGNGVDRSNFCLDCSHTTDSQRCYEGFWLTHCYQAYYSSQCEECINVWFSKNCRGCSNCFGCVNLRGKKYHIYNQPYAKGEYYKVLKEMKLSTWEGVNRAREKAYAFWLQFPNKFIQGVKNVNVSGEYIMNSKNISYGYLVKGGEDCKYVQYMLVPSNKNCYDHTVWGANNELSYENSVCGLGTYFLKFCFDCWPDVGNLEYSMLCKSSSDLFGCVGLRKKQYCILNKQYSESQYRELVSRIKRHMNKMPYIDKGSREYRYGEFFPIELNPYGYNNTIAQEHFPLTKEEVISEGYGWVAVEKGKYDITLRAEELSETNEKSSLGVVDEIIECIECKSPYRIIPQEYAFLQNGNLPLPRKCVDCRHTERLYWRNPPKFHYRQCQCAGKTSDNKIYQNTVKHFHRDNHCPNEFETSYAPERKEIVYCEACYQQEVV